MKSRDFSTLALFWNCMLLFDFLGVYPSYGDFSGASLAFPTRKAPTWYFDVLFSNRELNKNNLAQTSFRFAINIINFLPSGDLTWLAGKFSHIFRWLSYAKTLKLFVDFPSKPPPQLRCSGTCPQGRFILHRTARSIWWIWLLEIAIGKWGSKAW